ncbi:Hypothetical predicted protein [Paramuricea clavata]|uniref:Uncharacterized protein n=1 Tax=Paramuricea clavata TaxID=317549 RepID=A0A6S7J2S1_PARCT|nr:Hypothetical predicted protein [Paramuricea clavata]
MATYYARIREIAKKCSYTDENDAICDHLIKTMRHNNAIRVKAIRNNCTLQEILDEAAITEQAQLQVKEIKQKLEASETSQRVKYSKQDSCQRCGRKHDKAKCPACGAKCRKCGKQNHFAIVCRSRSTRGPGGNNKRRENSQYQRRDNKSERRETKSRQYSKPDDQSNYKPEHKKTNTRVSVQVTARTTKTSSNTFESDKQLD